jgi:hypothetical protein
VQQRARNRQTAQLTAGELTTPSPSQLFNPSSQAAYAARPVPAPREARIRGLWRGQQQVIAQGGAKQMHTLRNDADGLAQRLLAEICQQRIIKAICPRCGSQARVNSCSSVDLPQPVRPIAIAGLRSERLMPSSAFCACLS